MAPSKCAAPATTKGRAAKVAKPEEPTPAGVPAEVAAVSCPGGPVGELLSILTTTGTSSESCVAMLRAALPFALGVPSSSRHEHQTVLLEAWVQTLAEAEGKLAAEVSSAEAAGRALEAERASHVDKVQVAQEAEAASLEAKRAAEVVSDLAEAAAAAAAAEEAKKKASLEEAERAFQAKVGERQVYEKTFVELWEPLRSGAFAGKEWRAKHRAIEQLATLLEASAAPMALTVALPFALKERPETRGPFAQKVVDHAVAALQAHVELLGSQAEELRAAASSQEDSAAEAAAATAAVAARLTAARQESLDAQSTWLEAHAAHLQLANFDFAEGSARISATLAAAQERLTAFSAHIAAFEASQREAAAPDEAASMAGGDTTSLAAAAKSAEMPTLRAVDLACSGA